MNGIIKDISEDHRDGKQQIPNSQKENKKKFVIWLKKNGYFSRKIGNFVLI